MKSAEEDSGKIKEPVIIVSDVHLGGKGSNYPDFWDFLDWLTSLPATGKTFTCDGDEVTIKKPGTLVLLGDILELWDPEDDDRNNVLTDVLEPLTILNSLGCDIIYVIGNHDEDLLDFKHVWRKKNVEFPSNGLFDIVFRSYPRKIAGTEEIKGLQIGKTTYAFLHGHQFDRVQVFYKLSKFLSRKLGRQVRIDPIDWFQDLANVSFTKNVGKKVWNSLVVLVFIIYSFGYVLWLKDFQIEGKWGLGLGFFLRGIWLFGLFLLAVTIPPKLVTLFNTEIWHRLPPIVVQKCRPVKDVIEERYVPEKGKYINADVIVFGHTHYPGYYTKETNEKKRVFINTGCWVKLDNECEEKGAVPNTFLYIDAKAPYLLQWDKEKVAKGEITCIEDFR